MVSSVKFEFDQTDPSRWHLSVSEGRQVWKYDDQKSSGRKAQKQTVVDKYWVGRLGKRDVEPLIPKPKSAHDAAVNGFNFFANLQTEDGHWAGEYGGPLFLLPGLVIVCHVAGTPLLEQQRVEIIRYLRNMQRDDGGWGLHIEGESSILCSSTNYVTLRLLGCDANEPFIERARDFIKKHGGATGAPSWGKFWLSVLNVYSWEGVNPLLPELWLLPSWLPFHPSKMWCHCRQIYLPMSYCYAHRVQALETDLIIQLRTELYNENYEDIDWIAARNQVASIDVYAPHHSFLDWANSAMSLVETYHSPWLRGKALSMVLDHVRAEDLNSHYIGIGPISKMINMLVMYHAEGPGSLSVKHHYDRVSDYLWLGPDGMRMQGTNGSQLWDTALGLIAAVDSGMADIPQFQKCINRGLEFLEDCQIKQNTPDHQKYFRLASKGAFPFSTRDCGWTVSDCTAEGLKAVMMLQDLPYTQKLVPDHRLFDGIDVLLSMQNSDGGFASYEECRGPKWLELLNPSEVFGEIMIDYSYTQCSSAVVQALDKFKKHFPNYRAKEIDNCINRAIKFIKSQQREDGSWFGSWAICFTYAIWFGLEALSRIDETWENSVAVRKACEFLISKQMQDGGWGESYLACTEKVYIHHEKSQVVHTAWALLALMAAKYPIDSDVVRSGIRLLMDRQKENGEWKQEAIEGVFNKTCMISYPNYKFIFTVWALGKYAKLSQ